MFKEVFVGVIVMLLATTSLYLVRRKKQRLFQQLLLAAVCGGIMANLVYNFRYVIPEFWYTVKSGEGVESLKYGAMEGNLIAYRTPFRYPDQLLFSVLRNRNVYLSAEAGIYQNLLEMFAEDVTVVEVEKEQVAAIAKEIKAAKDLFEEPFQIPLLMEYTMGENQEWRELYEDDKIPTLYIDIESLEGKKNLIVTVDEHCNLFIMGREQKEK